MASKPLTEFDPHWNQYGLIFDCPVCESGHGIMPQFWGEPLYPSKAIWRLTGGRRDGPFDHVSVEPSINCSAKQDGSPSGCAFHGWVTDGKVHW